MATQMTTSFQVTNGTARVLFSHLCEKAPKTAQYNAEKYGAVIVIEKGSADEQAIRTGYQATADEAMSKYNVAIPPLYDTYDNQGNFVSGFLHDGDKKNEELAGTVDVYGRAKEPQKPIEAYRNAFYFKINSMFPIPLYDIGGVRKPAIGPNGVTIKDGKSDTYFIPQMEGSMVNFSIKFNVGIGVDSKTRRTYTFAKAYMDWIQQIVPGKTQANIANGPKAWTGNVPQPSTPAQPMAVPQAQPQTAPQVQYQPQTAAPYGQQTQVPYQQAQPQYQYQAQPQMAMAGAGTANAPVAPMPSYDASAADAGFYTDDSVGLPFPIDS